MDLDKDDILKILRIIEESGYDEVRLEVGDFKLHVQKSGGLAASAPDGPAAPAVDPPVEVPASPAPQPVADRPAATPEPEAVPPGMAVVRAPMLGTFYRAPAPGEKPFVEIGSEVGEEDTVCLLEVMKLFNSIKAGASGRIARILVANGAMVEYGQALMLIETNA